jgi:hypothetical protein
VQPANPRIAVALISFIARGPYRMCVDPVTKILRAATKSGSENSPSPFSVPLFTIVRAGP